MQEWQEQHEKQLCVRKPISPCQLTWIVKAYPPGFIALKGVSSVAVSGAGVTVPAENTVLLLTAPAGTDMLPSVWFGLPTTGVPAEPYAHVGAQQQWQ